MQNFRHKRKFFLHLRKKSKNYLFKVPTNTNLLSKSLLHDTDEKDSKYVDNDFNETTEKVFESKCALKPVRRPKSVKNEPELHKKKFKRKRT